MKITTYPTTRDGDRLTVHAGALVDRDMQGGLEDLLVRNIRDGVRDVRIVLDGMRFLHATLTAGLLAVQQALVERGGRVILVDAPWFVRTMMDAWEVSDRFLWVRSDQMGLRRIRDIREAMAAAEQICHEMDNHLDSLENLLG